MTDKTSMTAARNTVVCIAVCIVVGFAAFPYIKGYIPNERRGNAITLYNKFYISKNTFDSHIEMFTQQNRWADLSDVDLRQWKASVDGLNAFEPIGVDPALAAAVAEWKVGAKELVDFIQVLPESARQGNTDFTAVTDRARMMSKQLNQKTDRVRFELNRIASEVGGIVLDSSK